jgi:integrase
MTMCNSPALPPDIIAPATPLNTGRRGPVAKRRFQKGCFQLKDGVAYSFYYEDFERPDGSLETRKTRHLIGRVGGEAMSERAARREHDRIMQDVNRKRGSVARPVKGIGFSEAVDSWRTAVAPNFSPSTVRQYESHLRIHILPRFKDCLVTELKIPLLQQFATDLRKVLSRKSVVNVLTTTIGILSYAKRCDAIAKHPTLRDLQLGTEPNGTEVPFFTRQEATQIIKEAAEPYRTLFAVAWSTGLRAGELLALTVPDLDFHQKTIRVNKSSDDNTRQIRLPKTKNSSALLPMPSVLESILRNYLDHHWGPNEKCLLFPNKRGTKPRWRDNVVKYGLKPILKRLGLPTHNVGLHAFRHGLATELADASVPLPTLQRQMRHADVRTTLRVYAHAIPSTQREVMERIGSSISTVVPIGTKSAA